MNQDWLMYEKEAFDAGYKLVCGVDEAGRGPLAGPVCAAAVILPDNGIVIDGVNDSKKLSEKKRETLSEIIKCKALSYCVAFADVQEIEEYNILHAALLAMKRAVDGLLIAADYALIDGNKAPPVKISCKTIVKGDAKSMSVACASILAKVTRDKLMMQYANEYPNYSFEKHKGYGTKLHIEKLKEFGPCVLHRPSFLKKIIIKDENEIK